MQVYTSFEMLGAGTGALNSSATSVRNTNPIPSERYAAYEADYCAREQAALQKKELQKEATDRLLSSLDTLAAEYEETHPMVSMQLRKVAREAEGREAGRPLRLPD